MNAIDVLQQIARIEIERGMAPDEAIERGMSAVGRAQQFIAGQSTSTPSRIDSLPDLPKLPNLPEPERIRNVGWSQEHDYTADQMNAHYLKGYEAGSAAAAQAAKQVPAGWISVEDRLPEPYADVLVKRKDGTQRAARLNRAGYWELATYKDANRHQYFATDVVAWLDVTLGETK